MPESFHSHSGLAWEPGRRQSSPNGLLQGDYRWSVSRGRLLLGKFTSTLVQKPQRGKCSRGQACSLRASHEQTKVMSSTTSGSPPLPPSLPGWLPHPSPPLAYPWFVFLCLLISFSPSMIHCMIFWFLSRSSGEPDPS